VSTEACCTAPGRPRARPVCPLSGATGRHVPWRTVAALTAVPPAVEQEFWLCPDPECDVVYFGAEGRLVMLSELRVRPGMKNGGELLCYCLQFRKQDLQAEDPTAPARIPQQIEALVKAGECSCEVRNPSGRCCLGEVRKFVRGLAAARAGGDPAPWVLGVSGASPVK
jgi:hypothetical protein